MMVEASLLIQLEMNPSVNLRFTELSMLLHPLHRLCRSLIEIILGQNSLGRSALGRFTAQSSILLGQTGIYASCIVKSAWHRPIRNKRSFTGA
jgi:hypothetical protein